MRASGIDLLRLATATSTTPTVASSWLAEWPGRTEATMIVAGSLGCALRRLRRMVVCHSKCRKVVCKLCWRRPISTVMYLCRPSSCQSPYRASQRTCTAVCFEGLAWRQQWFVAHGVGWSLCAPCFTPPCTVYTVLSAFFCVHAYILVSKGKGVLVAHHKRTVGMVCPFVTKCWGLSGNLVASCCSTTRT